MILGTPTNICGLINRYGCALPSHFALKKAFVISGAKIKMNEEGKVHQRAIKSSLTAGLNACVEWFPFVWEPNFQISTYSTALQAKPNGKVAINLQSDLFISDVRVRVLKLVVKEAIRACLSTSQPIYLSIRPLPGPIGWLAMSLSVPGCVIVCLIGEVFLPLGRMSHSRNPLCCFSSHKGRVNGWCSVSLTILDHPMVMEIDARTNYPSSRSSNNETGQFSAKD